jgi:para-nitrobenzyl esterase
MSAPSSALVKIKSRSGTDLGTILGLSHLRIERFLGIPYALPPLDDRRFRPSEAHAGFSCDFEAFNFGPASAQVFDPHEATREDFGAPLSQKVWVGSEDSLTLNIWRPQGAKDCPVIFWIHGGANWLESSRLPVYDGEIFAREGFIFVSFNYRLGIFGFLDLSPIGGFGDEHSLGLGDQALALAWVADHIEAFGGNPNAITVMGESAGSMDIGWLVASGRMPKGVERLILMSGQGSLLGLGHDGVRSCHHIKEGQRRATGFLQALGFAHIDELKAASTDKILIRHAKLARPDAILFGMDSLFYPRFGTDTAKDPFTAAALGAFDPYEVMIGFTNYEMGLWLLWDNTLDQRSAGWAAQAMPFLPEPSRGPMAAFYDQFFAHEPQGVRGMHLLGDAMFAMPSLKLADLIAERGGKVFVYRFDWQADARRRALHAADQVILFDQQTKPGGLALVGPRGADASELSRTMRAAFTGFAREGKAYIGDGLWPAWNKDHRHMALFDNQSQIVTDPMAQQRRLWYEQVYTDLNDNGQ